ncbi:proline-rich protein 27 [Microcaecilia unicolor]|uniref:Uncharacterized protein LOC115475722 n=1 Tax=Microcaecilia unicolor TaxID=1415580 RepID=A0A6P7YVZ0_9AMPH|nr:uncharacterized protein LOC115475722 [Microcaecilia unicolor]
MADGPTAFELTADAPTADDLRGDAPMDDTPMTDELTGDAPMANTPTAEELTNDVPTANTPTAEELTNDVPTAQISTAEESTTSVPKTVKPTAESTAHDATANTSMADKHVVSEPMADESTPDGMTVSSPVAGSPTTSSDMSQDTLGKRQAPREAVLLPDVSTKQRRQQEPAKQETDDDLEDLMKELRQKIAEKGSEWIRDRCQLKKKKEPHPSSKRGSTAGSSDIEEPQSEPASEGVPSVILSVDSDAAGAPKVVWICGDSFVYWAARRARASPLGEHLGLAKEGIRLHWLGTRGMVWDELVLSLLHRWICTPPAALVIHLGANDLLSTHLMTLTQKMEMDLIHISELFPSARIGWSNIIPRLVWDEAINRRATEKTHKKVNQWISKFVLDGGGFVVSHETISTDCSGLYRLDGGRLSSVGLDIFNANLREAIEKALLNPDHSPKERETPANESLLSEPLANPEGTLNLTLS